MVRIGKWCVPYYRNPKTRLQSILQMVSLLLNKGANVHAKDKKETQAVHWAAYHGKWYSNFQSSE